MFANTDVCANKFANTNIERNSTGAEHSFSILGDAQRAPPRRLAEHVVENEHVIERGDIDMIQT